VSAGLFPDKVAVVTGAGSGIGRELAIQLASRGARLALSDINMEGLVETAALCGPGTEVRTYRLDTSKREAIFAHAEEVRRDFGTAHFIFNNAGVTMAATFENMTPDEMEWLLSIDLYGVIWGSKAFLPMMLAQGEGHIVNISSVFGFIGYPAQSAYNIAKFGVRGLNECLWRELEGSGVKAVSVHPGGIKTNLAKAAPMGKHAGKVEMAMMEKTDKLLVTPPAECVFAILDGIAHGRDRIVVGKLSSIASWLPRLFPRRYHGILQALGI
jgi:NAD(P)-dependent dehydrogenase (short-subunit alcohol dehydrogenase family)